MDSREDNPSTDSLDQERERARHWKRIGPMLERRRVREMVEMTDDERRDAIRRVLQLVRPDRPSRTTSGLVDYYKRMKHKKP